MSDVTDLQKRDTMCWVLIITTAQITNNMQCNTQPKQKSTRKIPKIIALQTIQRLSHRNRSIWWLDKTNKENCKSHISYSKTNRIHRQIARKIWNCNSYCRRPTAYWAVYSHKFARPAERLYLSAFLLHFCLVLRFVHTFGFYFCFWLR